MEVTIIVLLPAHLRLLRLHQIEAVIHLQAVAAVEVHHHLHIVHQAVRQEEVLIRVVAAEEDHAVPVAEAEDKPNK